MSVSITRFPGKLLAVLISTTLAVGCAARIWPSSRGVREGGWLAGKPEGNWSRSKLIRHWEHPYNHRSRQSGEPGICVAFSGGGLRSASFTIGVLSGLHDRGILREIDRASSVSGGGYGLSWYLVHHYDAWKAWKTRNVPYDAAQLDDALFDENGAEQKRLESGMDILANPLTTIDVDNSTLQAASALLATVPMAGVNLFANGLFGWHANVSPMRRFYQSRIERVFHYNHGDFTSLGVWDLGRTDEVTLGDLKRMLAPGGEGVPPNMHLPYPIFVTAANLNHTSGSAALHVANRLFEVTPAWSGSDAFNYRYSRPFDLHHAVAVSGAAVDSQVLLSGPPSAFASLLDMDLGFHIDNPLYRGWSSSKLLPKQLHRLLPKLLPFPFYLPFGWQNDQEGWRIHLTDGGHAENLGAFPLFRRLCRQVLIVDGTYDPNLGSDDYRVLREALRGELGLTLAIPAIDQWIDRQIAVSRVVRALHKQDNQKDPDLEWEKRLNDDLAFLYPAWVPTIRESYSPPSVLNELSKPDLLALLDRIRRAVGNHLAESRKRRGSVIPTFENLLPEMAWLLLGPEDEIQIKKMGEQSEWIRMLDAEVLEGTLAGLKRPSGGGEVSAQLDVFYLKLKLSRDVRLNPWACQSEGFPEDACTYLQKKRKTRDFPQDETGDLSFEREQFRAYRALGKHMAEWLCLGKGTRRDGYWVDSGGDWSRRPLELCSHPERQAVR